MTPIKLMDSLAICLDLPCIQMPLESVSLVFVIARAASKHLEPIAICNLLQQHSPVNKHSALPQLKQQTETIYSPGNRRYQSWWLLIYPFGISHRASYESSGAYCQIVTPSLPFLPEIISRQSTAMIHRTGVIGRAAPKGLYKPFLPSHLSTSHLPTPTSTSAFNTYQPYRPQPSYINYFSLIRFSTIIASSAISQLSSSCLISKFHHVQPPICKPPYYVRHRWCRRVEQSRRKSLHLSFRMSSLLLTLLPY
jgi:hypothetical protein